jgi:hypothetical protein
MQMDRLAAIDAQFEPKWWTIDFAGRPFIAALCAMSGVEYSWLTNSRRHPCSTSTPPTPPPTWRDFFIHIATIVIGLIIAIALEQTVEFIHHAHQRSELLEDLQRESNYNKAICEGNIPYFDQHLG